GPTGTPEPPPACAARGSRRKARSGRPGPWACPDRPCAFHYDVTVERASGFSVPGESDPGGAQQGGVFMGDHPGRDARHIVLETALALEPLAKRAGLQEGKDARGYAAGDIDPAARPHDQSDVAGHGPQDGAEPRQGGAAGAVRV